MTRMVATAATTPGSVDARRQRVLLSLGAIFGQIVFTMGWLVAGALEPDGYSSARHDSSDLASMTAHHAPWLLAAQAVGGALTIVFALGALGPSLAVSGRRPALGPWLVAGSLVGSELVTELFFRLDCRAADTGCTAAAATASWGGKLHVIVGSVNMLTTIAAPFVLAGRLRLLAAWRDLVRPAIGFGALQIVPPILYGLLYGSAVSGYLNRAPLILASTGLVVLAVRVMRLARPDGE